MQADMKTLHKMLHTRQVMYQHSNRRPLSANATAQLLSNTLYFKRFFPHYTFNMVAGLDDQGTATRRRYTAAVTHNALVTGKGAVYTYDAIGSYERVGYACQGSGKELVQPALDNRLKAASPLVLPPKVQRGGNFGGRV